MSAMMGKLWESAQPPTKAGHNRHKED